MGLLGILAGLGLLVWLSFRGWSVLLLAPAAALIAAAFAREPLLAHWTQTFMVGAADFLAQFFPLCAGCRRCGPASMLAPTPLVSHRESYFDIFMVAIVGALIALAAVIVLGSAFGSF
jgi:H+/gluconate symporter-like permease